MIDVDGIKLGYFPFSCFLMFATARRRKTLAVCGFALLFPTGFYGPRLERRGPMWFVSFDGTDGERRTSTRGMEDAARVSGTVVPKYIVAVGRVGDPRGTRRTKDAIIG